MYQNCVNPGIDAISRYFVGQECMYLPTLFVHFALFDFVFNIL